MIKGDRRRRRRREENTVSWPAPSISIRTELISPCERRWSSGNLLLSINRKSNKSTLFPVPSLYLVLFEWLEKQKDAKGGIERERERERGDGEGYTERGRHQRFSSMLLICGRSSRRAAERIERNLLARIKT